MVDNFEVSKKVRYFKRLSMTDIMLYFNKKNTIPIFVSHQILNGLNYMYYEALHYGYPLVHNSTYLEECGYSYSENNISECVDAILKAYTTHNKTHELYLEKSHKYLEKIDPFNKEVGKIWNGLISAGISQSLE
jgi:hypothetical protein